MLKNVKFIIDILGEIPYSNRRIHFVKNYQMGGACLINAVRVWDRLRQWRPVRIPRKVRGSES